MQSVLARAQSAAQHTRRSPARRTAFLVCLSLGLTAVAALAAKPGITRISLGHDGSETDGISRQGGISKNGNLVAFFSDATNIIPDDNNGVRDIFVYDRKKRVMTRVSVSSDGEEANGASLSSVMSDNGMYIAFHSAATNLVADDNNDVNDVFVHNLKTGETRRVSVSSDGTEGNVGSAWPSISKNGRYVAFRSGSDNLVPDDTNEAGDTFVHDLKTGETTRASITESGDEPNGASIRHTISPNGRYVAVLTAASNVVAGVTNGFADIFVHDWRKGRTELVTRGYNGDLSDGDSWQMKFSGNSRYLSFPSWARNLVPDDTNETSDIFVWSMKDGSIVRASVSSTGEEGNDEDNISNLSQSGHLVFFASVATNLVDDDTNGVRDLFMHDFKTGDTTRITVTESGDEANAAVNRPFTRRNGRVISFFTAADNVLAPDGNGADDVFVIDRKK